MAVESCGVGDWDGRWSHVQKFLERTGPFTHPDFEPSEEVRKQLDNFASFLVLFILLSLLYIFLFLTYFIILKDITVSVGNMQNPGHWSWGSWL